MTQQIPNNMIESLAEEIGEPKLSMTSVLRANHLWLNGKTVGAAASTADLKSADYETLFKFYWANLANGEAAVGGGRGASAQADWDANKTLALPDFRGRSVFGRDDMGGTAALRLTPGSAAALDGTVLGKAGGNQEHQLTEAQLAAHTHTETRHGATTKSGSGVGCADNTLGTVASGSTGGNAAHTNLSPAIICNVVTRYKVA